MEKPERDAEQSTPQYSAPILPENAGEAYVAIPEPQPFTATLRERLLALLIYIPAYLYCCSWNTGYAFLIFCAFFIAMTEWRHWEEKRSLESWVWLGCLAVTVLSAPLGRNRVWGDLRLLFAHGFAIYWVLCRSGRLSGGESGHLLPLDALNGAVIFPAKHFFLRIRTVFYTLTHLRGADQKRQPVVVFAVVLALAAALSLLVLAIQELSGADAVFQDGAKRFLALLTPQIDDLVLWRFLLSLPIGAYLFGLVSGTGRESIEALRGRGEAVESCLRSLRKVPFGVWIAVMAVFFRRLSRILRPSGQLSLRRVHPHPPRGLYRRGIRAAGLLLAVPRDGGQLCAAVAGDALVCAAGPREKERSAAVYGHPGRKPPVRRDRRLQAVSLHLQLRLHAAAAAIGVADRRAVCGLRVRALRPLGRQKGHEGLDALCGCDSGAAAPLLSRTPYTSGGASRRRFPFPRKTVEKR